MDCAILKRVFVSSRALQKNPHIRVQIKLDASKVTGSALTSALSQMKRRKVKMEICFRSFAFYFSAFRAPEGTEQSVNDLSSRSFSLSFANKNTSL